MTWAPGSPCGVILYPALLDLPYNWSSERAWAANDWTAESGTPSRDATHALFGDWAMKLTGAALQVARARFVYDPDVWGVMNPGPFAQYGWVYVTAVTGDPILRLHCELETAGDNGFTTFSTDFHLNTLELDAWHLVRNVSPTLSPTQQTNFERVDYRVELVPNGGSATLWADGLSFGYFLDLQDMIPAPVQFDAPMPDTLTQDRILNIAEDGEVESERFAGLRRVGKFNAAYFDDDGLALVNAFFQYAAGDDDGKPRSFTLVGQQYDPSRNVVLKARLTNPKRGVIQLEETPLYSWEQEWREAV